MITLSNGHSFTFMAASGSLAFDGRGWPWEWPLRWSGLLDPSLFTVVTKTLTRHSRRGNLRWHRPWAVVKGVPGGAVNAIGLTNPGIEWWCRRVVPRLLKLRFAVIVSLETEEEEEVAEMIRILRQSDAPVVGIELNASCPNTTAEGTRKTEKTISLVRRARGESPHPLLLKLGVTHDFRKIAAALKGVVEAININSVPWSVAYPDKKSPLEKYGGGGVSGRIAQEWTWRMARDLVPVGVPVVGPSPWNYNDLQKLFDLGCPAISFGSVFLRHPWRPTAFVRRWIREHS